MVLSIVGGVGWWFKLHVGFLLCLLDAHVTRAHVLSCSCVLQLPHVGWGMVYADCSLDFCTCALQLEQLTITGDEQTTAPVWASGLDGVPPSWSQLTKLTCLELRCHQLLDTCVFMCSATLCSVAKHASATRHGSQTGDVRHAVRCLGHCCQAVLSKPLGESCCDPRRLALIPMRFGTE